MDYIESLRRKIGHDEIIAVGAGVFPVRDGKVLLQRRRDNIKIAARTQNTVHLRHLF